MATWDAGLVNSGILRTIANQSTQDIPNNRTIVDTALYLINNVAQSRWANGIWYWSVSYDGVPIFHNGVRNYSFAAWEAKWLGGGSNWVGHNADGTRSVTITGAFSDIPSYGWFSSGSYSGSLALTRIPRGPRVKHSGTWKQTVCYVKQGGVWKIAIPYVKQGGVWKIGGG